MIGQLLRWNKIPLMKRAVITAGQAASSQGVSLAAAGCAFYATLALFPTIAMLISLYGLAYDPDTVQPQLHYLRHFMPPAAYSLISERIQSLVSQPARGLGISFLISLALSLWSSAAGTKSVLNALSLAYGQDETRGIIRFQLVSLGMTLIAIVGARSGRPAELCGDGRFRDHVAGPVVPIRPGRDRPHLLCAWRWTCDRDLAARLLGVRPLCWEIRCL